MRSTKVEMNTGEQEDIALQKEWDTKGANYAKAITEMVAFGKEHGWDNWQGEEAEDKREHLGNAVLERLKQANVKQEVEAFRAAFPPAYLPLIPLLEGKAQFIGDILAIGADTAAFLAGTSYESRTAYLVEGTTITALNEGIIGFGKSKRNKVFAMAYADKITTHQGWMGPVIAVFDLGELDQIVPSKLIPFNDGKRLLFVSSEGIYLLEEQAKVLIHPNYTDEEKKKAAVEGYELYLDMENAALSHDNNYIVVGDQDRDHRILRADGTQVGTVGPQSSYPHYCLFAKNDQQLIANSCHFYNGVTLGVDGTKLEGLQVEAYEESDDFIYIDEGMRVYAGVALQDCYVLGDAYGYIRAINQAGEELWQYFIGGTISGLAVDEEESVLWVGTYSGVLHQLELNKAVRDTHTIATGQLYENFRLLIWKDEPQVWRW